MSIQYCLLTSLLLITQTYALVYRWSKLSPSQDITNLNTNWLSNAGMSEEFKTKFDSLVSDVWKIFKINFKRQYTSLTEEMWRFDIFSQRMFTIYTHNSLYELGQVNFELGVNEFSDKTEPELKHLSCFRLNVNYTLSGSTFLPFASVALPPSINWREKGAVTPVKDQGKCGSCYAFSGSEAIEAQHFRKTGKLISLSEQQVVDCSSDFGNEGCSGGLMDNVFEYVKAVGGIEAENDYPYTSGESGYPEECAFNKQLVKAQVTGYMHVPSGDENALQQALAFHGPISVAVNSKLNSFHMYKGGVYSDPECHGQPTDLSHGILLVGYDELDGIPYWLVKNSWGSDWGDGGYIKILRNGTNTCGIATMASFPLV